MIYDLQFYCMDKYAKTYQVVFLDVGKQFLGKINTFKLIKANFGYRMTGQEIVLRCIRILLRKSFLMCLH